jgi:hypothetical protein
MPRGFSTTLLTGEFQIYLRPCTASTLVGIVRFSLEENRVPEQKTVPFLIISRFHLLHTALVLIDTRVSLFSRSVRGGQFVLLFSPSIRSRARCSASATPPDLHSDRGVLAQTARGLVAALST